MIAGLPSVTVGFTQQQQCCISSRATVETIGLVNSVSGLCISPGLLQQLWSPFTRISLGRVKTPFPCRIQRHQHITVMGSNLIVGVKRTNQVTLHNHSGNCVQQSFYIYLNVFKISASGSNLLQFSLLESQYEISFRIDSP